MKKILLSAALLSTAFIGFAQGNGQVKIDNEWGQNGNGNAYGHNKGESGSGNESSGATQATHVALSNAIEITFTNTMSEYGSDVSLAFSNVNDYANGIESDEQELRIRSNKNFSVAVKTNSDKFSYAGTTSPAPAMPVSGVLALKVTGNSTGGTVATPFSETGYATLNNTNQELIAAASRGGNQTFGVKYKATPGFAYPAGTYSVDVVYTATQQ